MLRTTASVLILSAAVLACVEVPPVHHVSRSFTVHVRNDFGQVAGLKIKISHFRTDEFAKLTDAQQRSTDPNSFVDVIAESTTDDKGVAHFGLNRTGQFDLSTEGPATQTWIELDVSDKAGSPVVELQWPSTAILRTAQLRGKLAGGLYSSHSIPVARRQLKLHTLIQYGDIAAATTDEVGAFDFGTVAPGLYFLQILAEPQGSDGLSRTQGNIPIYVTANDPRTSLSISVENTDCGLFYDLEENKARYKPESCFKDGKPVKCLY